MRFSSCFLVFSLCLVCLNDRAVAQGSTDQPPETNPKDPAWAREYLAEDPLVAKDAVTLDDIRQGLASLPKIREFRGFVIAQEGGIAALVFRRGSLSCSFNFLTPVPSFENNYWLGYSTRTVQEKPTGDRVTRLVYEHLGQNRSAILSTARNAGFCEADDLVPYHKTLLKPEDGFS